MVNVREVYHGSNGEATKALYARLETLGPAGIVALNLFRAQKCSARAKGYRRRVHKREAYDRKNWSLQNLCEALGRHAETLGIVWGWKEDPEQEYHRWVLYVVLPTGQVSFHSATALSDQRFAGDWDRSHDSAAKILLYTMSLLGEKILCDTCEERWEATFFCRKCSVQETDLSSAESHHFVRKDVCLNCCWCHMRGQFQVPASITETQEDLPF